MYSVVQVIPTDNFTVYVYFADGVIKLYDVKPLLEHGIFTLLKDKNFFKERCTVLNTTLAWDRAGSYNEYECIDIDPDTIYAEGVTVKDPLTQTT